MTFAFEYRSQDLGINLRFPSVSSSCGAGFTGQQVTTTSYSGASCTPSTYTDTSACVPQGGGGGGSPTCTVTAGSENGFPCPATYTGWVFRNWTQDSCTGTTYGAWDYSACVKVPDCTSNVMTETQSCPPGQTGNQTRAVTTNSCTGVTYSPWDTASCTNKVPDPKICPPAWEAYSYNGAEPNGWSFNAICFNAPQGIEGDRTSVQCYLIRTFGPQLPPPPEGPWDGVNVGARTLTCKASGQWLP